MKTAEQIIEWLKGQEWYEKFRVNAGFFLNESALLNHVIKHKRHPIYSAFLWPDDEYEFWRNADKDYTTWLHSDEEKPESVPDDSKFIFDGGKREAPFYMVSMDDISRSGLVQFFFPAFEQALKKAHEMAKIKNCKAYVLAAVGEIQPEVVTKAVSINDMEIRDSNLSLFNGQL